MALMPGDLDLPAPVSADLPAPARADLPAPRPAGPTIQKRGATAAGTMVGMGGPRIAKMGGEAPSAAAPAPDAFDLGLPGGDGGGHEADLPDLLGGLPAVAAPKKPPAPMIAKRANQTIGFEQGGDFDLPSPANVDLPAPAHVGLPAPANVGLPSATKHGLPSPKAMSPSATALGGFGEIDLPVVSNDLPAPAHVGLPTIASALPSVANALPSVASALPSVANALPSVANALPSVANALPSVADALPSSMGGPASIPAALGGDSQSASLPPAFGGGDDFGELELPRAPTTEGSMAGSFPWEAPKEGSQAAAAPAASIFDENPFTSVPPQAASGGGGGFGEFDIPGGGGSHGSAGGAMPGTTDESVGGMAFGELDLGGGGEATGDEFGEAALGSVIQPPPTAGPREVSRVSQFGQLPAGEEFPPPDAFGATAEAPLDNAAVPRGERPVTKPSGPSPLPRVLGVLAGLVVLGGSLMMFTQYGAFGTYAISDARNKVRYEQMAKDGLTALHEGLKTDAYGDSQKAADKLAAQRAAAPRARTLTCIAAIAELETELRFGKEPERANRTKLWITAELPEPRAQARYLDVASAAVLAVDRQTDKARAAFESAGKKYGTSDPIAQDIAFMRGELELRAGDGAAAKTAFTKALQLAPGGRAHFALARAAFLTGDVTLATQELSETIKAFPTNGAALVLRANLAWSQSHDDSAATAALKDLATLLDGPARNSISTEQQAQAYAQRGAIQFARGRTAEARVSFEESLKIDARNVDALLGQGDVFNEESRSAEAVSRYETAKQTDPNSVRAIVGAARMKIKLEKLADAKADLQAAVKKFPKSALAMQWLGAAEDALGNRKDAEKAYQDAVTLADPKDPDAIYPYAAYSEFMSREGRVDDAQAKLKEAVDKLPDTALLQRALGDVAEEQGQHADAISHYRNALSKDALDVTTMFALGKALSRANQTDEAAKQFDAVYAADKSYPGLALERGVLLQRQHQMDEALKQFESALEKHPNDPDLLLRVGAALVILGKPDDALPKLKEAQRQRTNSAEIEHYIGRAKMQQGGVALPEAMRHLRTAVDRDPNSAEYHLYVGWLANDMGDQGLAKKEIQRALELDNNLAEGYLQKGVYEYKDGANSDAEKDLRKALDLQPTLYDAHAWLAQVYDQQQMIDRAIAEWRIAFQSKDDDVLWNQLFGQLLHRRGLEAEAAKHLKAATEAAEQMSPRPLWLTDAEFPAAEAMQASGDKDGAIKHYTLFAAHADESNPYRSDALKQLRKLGAPYK
jgi:tetratricopeptide (TPR) repeat protein